MSRHIIELDKTTKLLQYFTSSAVTFAASDNSIAATGIGSGFTAGDYIYVQGSSEAGNNITHCIETVASGKLTISSATTIVDDNAGETITINQEYIGDWVKVDRYAKITAMVSCTGNASLLVDQSQDGSTVHYTTSGTSFAITGGTLFGAEISVLGEYARLRIRNNGADQTSMAAFLNGRTIS